MSHLIKGVICALPVLVVKRQSSSIAPLAITISITISASRCLDTNAPAYNLSRQAVRWSTRIAVRESKNQYQQLLSDLQKLAAAETGLSEAEMQDRIATLVALLPDIQPRVASMKVSLLAALVMDVDRVAQQLLTLKTIFPTANCSLMLVNELALLGESRESLAERAEQLRELLPRMNVDALVQVRGLNCACVTAVSCTVVTVVNVYCNVLPLAKRRDRSPERGPILLPGPYCDATNNSM
jgi:hypothetical protein